MKYEDAMTKATTGLATVGLAAPVWAPTMSEISAVAGALVPVLSAIWLLLQIVRLLIRWRKE